MALQYIGKRPPIIDVRSVKRNVDAALRQLAGMATKDFEATTSTWDTDVDFATQRQSPEEYSVGTDNEIYGYVSQGTRPHKIRAVNAPNLAFQTGYRAKTTPRQIGSSAGGPFGDSAFAKEVDHPGTEAREFDIAIAEKLQPEAERLIGEAAVEGIQ